MIMRISTGLGHVQGKHLYCLCSPENSVVPSFLKDFDGGEIPSGPNLVVLRGPYAATGY